MPCRHLFSFERGKRHTAEEVVERLTRASGGVRPDMILDSGAFSAATLGASVDIDHYIKWLRSWQPYATAAFSLDVIGDPAASARNHARLVAADTGVTILPVYHANSPVSYLHRMCEQSSYVGLGGLVMLKARRAEVSQWLARQVSVAQSHGAQVHALGVTSMATAQVPLYSCDSSSGTSSVRFGRLWLWDHRRAVLVGPKFREARDRSAVAHLLPRHGLTMGALADPDFFNTKTAARSTNDDRLKILEAAGYTRVWLEDHLVRRHHVPPPKGLTRHADTGTKVYIAMTDIEQHETAARAWAGAQTMKGKINAQASRPHGGAPVGGDGLHHGPGDGDGP